MNLTVKEAAARLRCSAATVYLLCAAGKLRAARVGLGRGKLLISEEAIAEYLGGKGEERASLPASPSPRPRPKLTFTHLQLKQT
jgi:excisionase family DNA binding protein